MHSEHLWRRMAQDAIAALFFNVFNEHISASHGIV
jgi:hypothetical protein